MAAVTFNTILLNLASDSTQVVSLWCIDQIGGGPQTPGEDRQYGTRIRGVDTGVITQTRALAAQDVDPGVLSAFLAMAGQTCCFRDPTGTKFYGTFRSPAVTWHNYDANADVSFTFTEQSYSEAAS